MKTNKFCVIVLLSLFSLGALANERPEPDSSTTVNPDTYLRECITAVTALLQSEKTKGASVQSCEDAALGLEKNKRITRSKVVIDQGELKQIEVWSGKRKHAYQHKMRMSNKCGCRPGTACCCDTSGLDMCCKDDFCCIWGKKGSPVCR